MQNTGTGNGPVPVGAQALGAGRSAENLMANRPIEEVPLGVLGRECKVPIESMGLFDLCAVKFRIVQRLENNRAAYNLVRMRKPFTDDEESDVAGGDLTLSRLKSRKMGGSQQYSDDEKQRKSSVSLAKKTPGVAGSRRRMNWDNLLSEIPNLAYEMQEQSKFKMAEASHLGRKARKEVMKKDNQSKGLKEYKKLLSTQLAIQVTREVRSIVTQSVPVQSTDETQPSDQSAKLTLAQTMKLITENCQLTSDTPFNIELERLDRNKQSCLREIHKVLSKWNKPQVKNFLKSQIFESVETIIEDRTAQNWQWHSNQSATTAPTANMDMNSVAGDQSVVDGPARSQVQGLPRTSVPVAPVTSITGGVQMVNTQNVSKETRKEDLKEREMNKLLKCENADEFSALYLNKASTTDGYRKIFKTSIEAFSSFPKSFDEVPVAPQAILKEDEMWENKNFFGTQTDASMVESGLTQYFDQMSATAKEFPEIFGTPSGNSGALSFNNHHEKVFEALSKGMMVVYEHLATERGESYNGLDTFIKILNPGRSEHFLDDHISMWPLRDQTTLIGPDFLPYAASLHPLLHYTLHRLENRFGKRWFWIEALLKSNPLFRGYKLSARTIGKLSIFFHMLSGERVLQNHRQQIPGERIVNMEFFPTDVSSKKRLVPGRKPKNRSREKEENDYTAFRAKFEAEKLRLPWNNTPDASIPNELFYNKAVEYLKSRQAVHNNAFKRFKPSRGRQTFSSGIPGLHTAGSSTSANGEPRPERFNDRPPSEALGNSEDKGKMQIQNYIKHLKRRREMFIQNTKTNLTPTA